MNQKRSILNLFVCLSVVLLVVLSTFGVVSAGDPAAEKTEVAFLAANPELMFARRYVAAETAKRAAAFPACYEGHH